jgi:hypothetical protein
VAGKLGKAITRLLDRGVAATSTRRIIMTGAA